MVTRADATKTETNLVDAVRTQFEDVLRNARRVKQALEPGDWDVLRSLIVLDPAPRGNQASMADLMEEIGAPESRYREVFTSLNSAGYISIDDDHDTTTVRLGERAAVVAQLHWNIEALSEGMPSSEAWEILEDALD